MVVVVGALVVTALGIDAADTFTGSTGTLLSQVIRTSGGGCSDGMVAVENVPGLSCIDAYEESAHAECPNPDPDNVLGSLQNITVAACVPVTKAGSKPWRYITRDQAMQACARVGKRLPTNEEWYVLSLGMTNVDEDCNVSSGNAKPTGSESSCKTPHGAYDMVGNLWEWVSDDITNGEYRGKQIPQTGFVTQVDQAGMAVTTGEGGDPLFGEDYFWSRTDGTYGVIRGGYYDSGVDGGVYTAHADTLPTTASVGIGFRCVQ